MHRETEMSAAPKNCHRFTELTAPRIRKLAASAVTILPIAAIEQHGPHLCTGTDTFINEGLQDLLFGDPPEGEFLFLPTLWLGASEHHRDYGGTLSLKPSTYIRILVDLLLGLADAGHRKIALINSHGGNHAPMQSALAECAREAAARDCFVVGVTYWEVAESRWKQNVSSLTTTRMGHACELETSMIWSLLPDLSKESPPGESPFPRVLDNFRSAALPFPRLTREGHMGDPDKANAEKGRELLVEAATSLRSYLSEFYQATLPSDNRDSRGAC